MTAMQAAARPSVADVVAGLDLPDTEFTRQALALGVEDVADLLAALAERDLRWTPGEAGECGTLIEGAPEPPDLHVVFDTLCGAWQRDDARAEYADESDPSRRWFGPSGTGGTRRTWTDLQRQVGPLTPDGGIAPTTPRHGGDR